MELALRDLRQGLLAWRIWLYLGWVAVRVLYSRTLLGSLWITFSFSFFVGVKIFIMTRLFATDTGMASYPLHITIGFLIFMFISSAISSGTTFFVSSKSYIDNGNNPLSIYVLKDLFRVTYSLTLNSVVVLALIFIVQQKLGWACLSIVPAILVMLLNGIWVKLLLGTIGARFRDVRHLVDAIMRVMLFLSPVLWMKEQVGDAIQILWWNPIYHFIEIIRFPILEGVVPLESWLFVGVCTVVGSTVALTVYSKNLKQIHHWI